MSVMDPASSFVYSLSRPLHPTQAQTKQYLQLEEYAYQRDIQALLHDTLSKLFQAQPADPLAFIIEELQAEKNLRDQVASGEATVTDASAADKASVAAASSGDKPSNDSTSADLPVAETTPVDMSSTAASSTDAPAPAVPASLSSIEPGLEAPAQDDEPADTPPTNPPTEDV